jgi:multidrug efflux pump subunit AcrB
MAAIVLLGVLSYRPLPVAALPDVDSPTIQVIAQLPGADPQTMASSVATPLERQFGQIPGLSQMSSSSALGYTQITLQFGRNRTVDSAAQDVQAAINATAGQLPTNLLNPPIYRKVNPTDTPILLIAMTSDSLPLTKVSDYANSILAQKLSQMPGVLAQAMGDVISAVAVPLSLIGTFAVMYALGFSLDNLSLMGLTIAVGFVGDDAVVMIENIARHNEAGLTPMEAAIKGAGEIGFTIVSISISRIAVFIPLFLMSGIVGLLFREFAITVAASIVVSVVVSLTLTPMMCARLLTPEKKSEAGRLSQAIERFFEGLVGVYDRALTVALRHRFVTLMTMIATVCLTIVLFLLIPKGFFPQHRRHLGGRAGFLRRPCLSARPRSSMSSPRTLRLHR